MTPSEGVPYRLLVVDDDPAIRNFLEQVLEREGHECDTVATCAEARAVFQKARYACAFIDLGLPDGSGLSLLSEFTGEDPCLVPIVLTGDVSADTVITTMRGGAFDYLRKPLDLVTLRAALGRAFSHHALSNDRAELFQLLLQEREQLRAKVEAATKDIRQYASACESSNQRLRGLLKLAQLSNHYYTEEELFREVFRELATHAPIRALALCDCLRQKMQCAVRRSPNEPIVVFGSLGSAPVTGFDVFLAEAEPGLVIQEWIDRNSGVTTSELRAVICPQALWKRSTMTVAFFLDANYDVDPVEQEFLDTCAYFLAFEWERGQLLFHIAHQASLGNIGVELARNFIQPLTAIQIAADFVNETLSSPEGQAGLGIIGENVDKLRRQTQEFRKLSMMRENAVETVRLDEYVDQALDMLSVAFQNRNVTVHREYIADCECVLLNGTALARTFLDIVLGALRAVDMGGEIRLRLFELDADHVTFEISHAGSVRAHGGVDPAAAYASETFERPPGLLLAERTIHSCGGTMNVELGDDGNTVVRIVLPRNATMPALRREGIM